MNRVRAVLAWIMTSMLLVTPLASAQQATPEGEPEQPSHPAVGTITVGGLDGGDPPQYHVTDGNGVTIAGGVLDSAYVESGSLVGVPGSVGTLVVAGNNFYAEATATAFAGDNGAYQFSVMLAPVEPVPTSERDSGLGPDLHSETSIQDESESLGGTEKMQSGPAMQTSGSMLTPMNTEDTVSVTVSIVDDLDVPVETSFVLRNTENEEFDVWGYTESDGRGVVAVMPGEYRLDVSSQHNHYQDYYGDVVLLDENRTSVSAVLTSLAVGSVAVLCAGDQDCAAHEGAWVSLSRTVEPWWHGGINLDSNGEGLFENVPVGAYELTVEPHGIFTGLSVPVTVTEGIQEAVYLEYTEGSWAPVTFQVAHEDGEPYYGGSISLMSDEINYWHPIGESGEVTINLQFGEYEYSSGSWQPNYGFADGVVHVTSDQAQTIDITYPLLPVIPVSVQDPDGNPIPYAVIETGQSSEGEFFHNASIHTGETGEAAYHLPDWITHWRVVPFDLWQGQSGEISGGPLNITLQPVSEFGTVNVTLENDDIDWIDVRLSSQNGWSAVVEVSNSEPASIQVPAGDYTWTASSYNWEYEAHSGAFTIQSNGTENIALTEFTLNPQITIVAKNQHGESVTDVNVYLNGTGGNDAWATVNLDEAGTGTGNLPYGGYVYFISAPTKYVVPQEGISWEFTSESGPLEIVLEELPNADLTVTVISDKDYRVEGMIAVLDGSGEELAAEWTWGTETVIFTGLPHGDGYTIVSSEMLWYPATTSDPFDFDDDHDGTEIITLIPYEPVMVTITATSSNENAQLPQWANLEFAYGESGYHTAHLTPQPDGTLTGSIELPKQEYQVDFLNWDEPFYTSDDLPTTINLTEASETYALDLVFTSSPHGFATFEVTVPEGLQPTSWVEITRGDQYIGAVYFYQGQTSYQLQEILLPGVYSWTYSHQGMWLPASGEFTVTDGDVTVPVNLKIGQNGVALVTTVFPEGMDTLDRAGYMYLRTADGSVITSRFVSDMSRVALGPVLYGTYTLVIQPEDARLGELVIAPVNVNADTVSVAATLVEQSVEEPEATMLRFEVSTDTDEPLIGGVVVVWGVPHALDENGVVEVDTFSSQEVWYSVESFNFANVSDTWEEGQSTTISILLEDELRLIELHFEDDAGQPVPLTYISISADCSESSTGMRLHDDGYYQIWVGSAGTVSCGVYITDDSGVYSIGDSPISIPIIGNVTSHTVVLTRSDAAVSDVTLVVEFEGGLPTLDTDSDQQIRVSLVDQRDGEPLSIWATLDANGKLVLENVLPGTYDVSVWGWTDRWRYDQPEPAQITITADHSNQEVTITMPLVELMTVNFVIQTSDGVPLDLPVQVWAYGAHSWEFVLEDEMEFQVPKGEYTIYVGDTGLYRGEGIDVEITDYGQIIPLIMTRIAAVAVPEEPEPTVTATATSTATVTPTATATVTPTATLPPTEPSGPGLQTLIVRFELPGDLNIEGAPYSLYAPVAAQFMAEPFTRGVVGANNTIQIDGLIPGQYRLVVEPIGMPPIEVMLQIGAASVTEVLVRVVENGVVSVHYAAQSTPTPPGGPATDPTSVVSPGAAGTGQADVAGSSQDVTGLPSTGTGLTPGFGLPLAAMIAALALATIAIPLGIVYGGRNKR